MKGLIVSGSDQSPSKKMEFLISEGINAYSGHSATKLRQIHNEFKIAFVVKSSAVPPTNEEVLEAKEIGIPV